MIADNPARACSDVGHLPLENRAECHEAALSFGFPLWNSPMAGSWINYPKGCYICWDCSYKLVYWNNHETGSDRNSLTPICKAIGKYRLLH